jgi:hypothetical protein
MRLLKIFLLAASVLAAPLTPAFAKDFPAAEIAELQTAVDAFGTAMWANDTKSILKVMPPKILTFLKEKGKVSDEQLLKAVSDAMAAAMKDVKILEFKIDVAAATTQELADGTSYLLIPTVTKMEIADKRKFIDSNQTLALRDGGVWYLLRASDPQQQQILKAAYPAFEGVELPAGTLEEIKE